MVDDRHFEKCRNSHYSATAGSLNTKFDMVTSIALSTRRSLQFDLLKY